ncbi:hypothetical protein [Blastomonas sp.]|uniref:hypothetical protein n=1 Tax=Blastomonas sp. TaxID=1909299 RepID=UPI00261773AA|nr:hypothetical protein [Blastomonas sp.]MDM7956439.1 hypothetical protein [Blastomonas sp.]
MTYFPPQETGCLHGQFQNILSGVRHAYRIQSGRRFRQQRRHHAGRNLKIGAADTSVVRPSFPLACGEREHAAAGKAETRTFRLHPIQ